MLISTAFTEKKNFDLIRKIKLLKCLVLFRNIHLSWLTGVKCNRPEDCCRAEQSRIYCFHSFTSPFSEVTEQVVSTTNACVMSAQQLCFG